MSEQHEPPPRPIEPAIVFVVSFVATAMLCLTAIVLGFADALARWGLLAIPALPLVGWWLWRTRPR